MRSDDSRFRVRGLRKAIVCHAITKVHFSVIMPFSSRGCTKTHNSRSRLPCRSLFVVRGALGARHILQICNPSRAGIQFLHMLAVNVLLALRFFTSGINLQLIEYALAICNGKHHTILTAFTRARICDAMSLPPQRQQHFLQL